MSNEITSSKVVAQLVARSLPTPDISAKFMCSIKCIDKAEIKKKEAGRGPIFKKNAFKRLLLYFRAQVLRSLLPLLLPYL